MNVPTPMGSSTLQRQLFAVSSDASFIVSIFPRTES
jgi:hypothetical protein